MKHHLFKKSIPHVVALFVFIVVSLIYAMPAIEGKVVEQQDNLGWKGMAQQSLKYKEKYGHLPLWNKSMFGGMPSYTIALEPSSKLSSATIYLSNFFTLGLPKPISFFLISCICFYLLSLVLNLNPYAGIIAALSYAFSTYNILCVSVGHDTKLVAIGYAPAVIAGLLLILQERYLIGVALLALCSGLQFSTQHLQIIYYTGIICSFAILWSSFYAIREHKPKKLIVSVSLYAIAMLIGFGCYAYSMLPLKEYANESIRGGSQMTLPANKQKTSTGLDKEYAFQWSYGISETLSLIIPSVYGGGSDGRQVNETSEFSQKLSEIGIPSDQSVQFENSSFYWGDQPGTSGPVYFGAILCFLSIFGALYSKNKHKWWIIAVAFTGIFLSWGKNFPALNYFLFDHLPFYNKFRAPSMALTISQISFSLLAVLGMDELIKKGQSRVETVQIFKWSVYSIVLIMLLLGVFGIMASFKGHNDDRIRSTVLSIFKQNAAIHQSYNAEDFATGLMANLHKDRQSYFLNDLLRMTFLIGIASILIWLYIKNKIKSWLVLTGLGLLIVCDLKYVNSKYFTFDKFIEADEYEANFTPSKADLMIMNDPELNFRVFDQTSGDPFTSSKASYFHNSIGGYHPAKLSLYNDIIERQLYKGNMSVFNMLNTRYIIQSNNINGQPEALLNNQAFGNCWAIKGIHYVSNANDEITALETTNLKDTAVIQLKFKDRIRFLPKYDPSTSIKLIKDLNDQLNYDFFSNSDQIIVFSEIYYDKGWNAYIDGIKTDYFKADYVLRGLPVPKGRHHIEFKFEPRSYRLGNLISASSSILVYFLLLLAFLSRIKKYKSTAKS